MGRNNQQPKVEMQNVPEGINKHEFVSEVLSDIKKTGIEDIVKVKCEFGTTGECEKYIVIGKDYAIIIPSIEDLSNVYDKLNDNRDIFPNFERISVDTVDEKLTITIDKENGIKLYLPNMDVATTVLTSDIYIDHKDVRTKGDTIILSNETERFYCNISSSGVLETQSVQIRDGDSSLSIAADKHSGNVAIREKCDNKTLVIVMPQTSFDGIEKTYKTIINEYQQIDVVDAIKTEDQLNGYDRIIIYDDAIVACQDTERHYFHYEDGTFTLDKCEIKVDRDTTISIEEQRDGSVAVREKHTENGEMRILTIVRSDLSFADIGDNYKAIMHETQSMDIVDKVKSADQFSGCDRITICDKDVTVREDNTTSRYHYENGTFKIGRAHV